MVNRNIRRLKVETYKQIMMRVLVTIAINLYALLTLTGDSEYQVHIEKIGEA